MIDSTCIFIQQQIDAERKVYSEVPKAQKPIVIPNYNKEKETLDPEIQALLNAYPTMKEAVDKQEPYSLEITLSELGSIIPRHRFRIDAYSRLVRLLQTQNVSLVISSKRTKPDSHGG